MDDFRLEELIAGGPDHDVRLDVRYLGGAFSILYSPINIKAPFLLRQLDNFLNKLAEDDKSDVQNYLEPFKPLIVSSAPERQCYRLLSDFIYPPYFEFKATADADDSQITPRPCTSTRRPPGIYLHRSRHLADLEGWSKSYSSNQIHLTPTTSDEYGQSNIPRKVLVDGKPYFLKVWTTGNPPGVTLRQLCEYRKIQDSQIRPDLRIPRLHRVVIDTDDEVGTDPFLGRRLVGVLLTFIEKPKSMGSLFQVRDGNCSSVEFSRWACQLDECVVDLHANDI